ncbi:Tll0287-like domain-containing protein [Candidatus Colwellia aromaticivorans]|uniref:Tll0287-like domain-containing protein n=1 Tax=Candidatus Colwellia aromaticivorans TaxID=2267621 RepID=UPI000DF478FA|nr:DUF3365 domain-containing protein [Candidatus Colwellia aromaticivorans]
MYHKKNTLIVSTVSSILFLYSFSSYAQPIELSALKAEAITIVKQFGGTLKPQLKKALAEGGVKQAIEVCSVKAPEIAKNLSMSTPWQVKRVSLKTRNHHNATPDAWEKSVLEEFNQRQQQGESAKAMAKAEVVKDEFRFMKAQGTESLCLTCHGSGLNAETKAALKQYYPKDQAVGYSLGQIRGAFSLTKKL